MKIVDLKTFLALPTGTLFAKYEPCVFEALCIKGENCGENDFFYQEIVNALDYRTSSDMFDLLDKSQNTGVSLTMDFDCQSRDGCFVQDQLFAVFEPRDVAQLIVRLQKALTDQMGGVE